MHRMYYFYAFAYSCKCQQGLSAKSTILTILNTHTPFAYTHLNLVSWHRHGSCCTVSHSLAFILVLILYRFGLCCKQAFHKKYYIVHNSEHVLSLLFHVFIINLKDCLQLEFWLLQNVCYWQGVVELQNCKKIISIFNRQFLL